MTMHHRKWLLATSAALTLTLVPPQVGAVEIKLAWDPNPEGEGVEYYNVYYGRAPRAESVLGPQDDHPYTGDFAVEGPSPIRSDETEFTIHVPSCTGLIYFAVTAVNAEAESDFSEEISSETVRGPHEVSVTSADVAGAVDVSWSGLRDIDTGFVNGYSLHYDFHSWRSCDLDAECEVLFATVPRDTAALTECDASPSCLAVDGTGADEGASPITGFSPEDRSFRLSGLQPGMLIFVGIEAICEDGDSWVSVENSGVTGNVVPCDGVDECDSLTACEGDTLVLCALDAEGCLVEEQRIDCTEATNGYCDDSSLPLCETDDECTDSCTEGVACDGTVLVRCGLGAFGCLEEFTVDCAESGATCDPTYGACLQESPDGDGDADVDGDSDIDGDIDGDTDVDGDSDIDGDIDGDTDVDGDSDMDGDTDVDGDSDIDGDTDGDADSDGDTGVGATDDGGCSCGASGGSPGFRPLWLSVLTALR